MMMEGGKDGWMEELMIGWVNELMIGWMDDGWMNIWMMMFRKIDLIL